MPGNQQKFHSSARVKNQLRFNSWTRVERELNASWTRVERELNAGWTRLNANWTRVERELNASWNSTEIQQLNASSFACEFFNYRSTHVQLTYLHIVEAQLNFNSWTWAHLHVNCSTELQLKLGWTSLVESSIFFLFGKSWFCSVVYSVIKKRIHKHIPSLHTFTYIFIGGFFWKNLIVAMYWFS